MMNGATAGAREHPTPADIEAEQALLGAILVNNEAFDRVGDFLDAEHFHEPLHARVFEAIARTVRKGQTASPVTLAHYFSLDAAMKEVGGPSYLAELTKFSPSIMNAAHVGRYIHNLAVRRKVRGAADEIRALADDCPVDWDGDAVVEEAERLMFAVGDRSSGDTKVQSVALVAERAIKRAEVAWQNPGAQSPRTGLKSLDEVLTTGLCPADLVVLGGFTSMGKTSLGQQIGWHVADNGGPQSGPVGAWTLEMTGEQYTMRHIAQIAQVPANRIEAGHVNQTEMSRVVASQERFNTVALHIDDSASLTVSQIRSRARRLIRRVGKLKLILVDHLRFIRPDDPRANEADRNQQITRDLKALAKELDTCVLLLAHLNRDVRQRPNKRPIMSDLYGASGIEQNADAVLFVHREEYWLKQAEPDSGDTEAYNKWLLDLKNAEGRAELILAKCRRGPTGTAHCRFDGANTLFHDHRPE